MAKRKVTLTNLITGKQEIVSRGTKKYEQLKQRGYLSKQQLSHYSEEKTKDYIEEQLKKPQYKQHREAFEPTYVDEPEPTYIDVDEVDLLKDRISEMYDLIVGKLENIPNERYFGQTKSYVDFSEQKQMLLNAVDDFYAEVDDNFEFDRYVEKILPTVDTLINIITHSSDQDTVEYALTQLMVVLQGGSLDVSMAKTLGNMMDYQGSGNGWYEKSSRYSDNFSRTI